MADIRKHVEKAEKLIQTGKLEEAVQAYQLALKVDPNNDAVVESISELYLRLGLMGKGLESYGSLFDKHRGKNDTEKAIQIFRKMEKVGPQEPARMMEFARLMEKAKPKEAAEYYQHASELFRKQGNKAKTLEAVLALTALDPGNADLLRLLGEVADEAGQKEKAAESFLRAAEIQSRQRGAKDGSAAVLALIERAYKLAPKDGNIIVKLASAHLENGRADLAVTLLRPLVSAPGAPAEALKLMGEACMASGDFHEAEALLWPLAVSAPDTNPMLFRVAQGYLGSQQTGRAVELLLRLKNTMWQSGRKGDFTGMVDNLPEKLLTSAEILEFLSGLYKELNSETPLQMALERLFDIYFAEGNFLKAADAVERIAEATPSNAENSQRLQRLNGKIDDRRWQNISGRFRQTAGRDRAASAGSGAAPALATAGKHVAGGAPEAPNSAGGGKGAAGDSGEESNVLEDLMLQAEIFLQYGLKPRAVERLERIKKLFPGEEEKNEKLRGLFTKAGVEVQITAAPATPAAAAKPGAAPAAAPADAGGGAEEGIIDITRVTEITRNIYRQGTVKNVLFAAVNDVGRTWRVSKCVAALCTPGKTPSSLLEYCATGMKQSDTLSLVRLVHGAMKLTTDGTPLSIEDAESSSKLGPLAPVVKTLEIRSLLGLPLMEADQQLGVLVLEQCDTRRNWRSNEVMVLKTIVEQMVMATTHVKLRSLMKSLAVTDERSGMLNRGSYLDCLMAETKRAKKQSTSLCVALVQFGKGNQLVRENGEDVVRRFMEEAGQAVTSHLRQNDVAIKYDSTTLALVMPDTKGQDGLQVMTKMRRVAATVKLAEKSSPPPLTVGLAEPILDDGIDAVDSVTELINRAEEALAAAHLEGGNIHKLLIPGG